MSLVDTFLPEFDQEMRGTRSIIELVPDRFLNWKAHQSLNTVGWVASHLTDTLSWTGAILTDTSFDVAPVDGPPHESPVFDSAGDILTAFDQNLQTARSNRGGIRRAIDGAMVTDAGWKRAVHIATDRNLENVFDQSCRPSSGVPDCLPAHERHQMPRAV